LQDGYICLLELAVFSNFINAPARSMVLSGWKTANERQTVITSWFIGISAILLVLYLTEPKPDFEKEWFDYYFEAIAVILLIVSLFLFLLSATYLLKPFYQDNEPTKEQLRQSAVYTRRVQIPGVFVMFWAIGFLILLKLEFSNAVLAYSTVAFGSPILWLWLRKTAHMKF
jgi:hypothetical protein